MVKRVFLVDFDGTIALSDLALVTVAKFADKKWEHYEELFNNNKLSLEDTITAQYSLIQAPKEIILKEIDNHIKIRDNFTQFVNYCNELTVPLVIVSGGIDFIIRYVLDKIGISNTVQIVSMITEYQDDGSVKVTQPKRYMNNPTDFKHDLVLYYKSLGYTVYYIGDGSSDYGAVTDVDLTFTIKNSNLSSFCEQKELNYVEFDDFKEIPMYLENKG